MFNLSPVEMLILAVASGAGGIPHDVVSLMDADDYFKARSIAVQPDKLVKLAGTEPADTKAQVAQLLAIRWLEQHPLEARKVKGARDTLEQIASGDKAQDPLGFAKEYAQRALARFEGKPVPKRPAIPDNSVPREALAWFPEGVAFFGAMDFRASGEIKKQWDISPFRSQFIKMVPPGEKEAIYKFVDAMGPMRLDRISFGIIPDTKMSQKTKIYLRFTGLADRKSMADLVKKGYRVKESDTDIKTEYKKGPKGEIITLISSENEPPAYAIIGDHELIMAGYAGGRQGNSLELVQEVLEVRAGKKASLLKGAFAKRLKKVPAQASGLLMGDLPDEWRREMTGPGPFKAVPTSIAAYVAPSKALELHLDATMASADDAKTLADSIDRWKQMGIDGLKNLPPQMKVKPETIKTLQTALKGIKAAANDQEVTVDVKLSSQEMSAMHHLAEQAIQGLTIMGGPPGTTPVPPPPPPAKEEIKKEQSSRAPAAARWLTLREWTPSVSS